MSYKEVAEILKEYLQGGTTIKDVIMKKYSSYSTSKLKELMEEFEFIIDDVKSELGPVSLKQIYDYVSAPREEKKLQIENPDGTVTDIGTIEGNIKFDPNGEIPTVDDKPIDDGKIKYGDKAYPISGIESNSNLKFNDDMDVRKEDEFKIGDIDPIDLLDPTKYVSSSDVKFGDDNDRRNKPSDSGFIPEPVFGDEDKDINDILNNLNIRPKGFEFGDDSVRKPNTPKKSSESAFVGPISNNDDSLINIEDLDDIYNDEDDFKIDDSLLIKPLDFPNSGIQKENEEKKKKFETKIQSNMNQIDMIVAMAEGNPGAMKVLFEMASDPKRYLDILLCDEYGIRGSKLYMLNNDCCNRNMGKFDRTLLMIRCGIFSLDEIHQNLELVRAIPFIDDSIKMEGIPAYGEAFGPMNPKWDEYCNKNREVFIEKLNSALGQGGFGGK